MSRKRKYKETENRGCLDLGEETRVPLKRHEMSLYGDGNVLEKWTTPTVKVLKVTELGT